MAAGASPGGASANDALLVQLVRGALGRGSRGRRRINVSTSSFVVTLHGVADSDEERIEIEATVRRGRGGPGRGQQARGDPGAGFAVLFSNRLFGVSGLRNLLAKMEVANGEQEA